MCFSANESFISGSVLTIIGVASVVKAKTPSRAAAFASIPFIFAIQQFSEGFVWLSLTNSSYHGLQQISTYIFLIFAHITWPTWLPLSILLLEKKGKRKNILFLLLGAGIVLSSYYAFSLASYPVTAEIDGYHIKYITDYPSALVTVGSIFYGVATILPTFISSVNRMRFLVIAITLSYIATSVFYHEYIVSVWCYFAALLSVIIYWILYGLQKISFNKSSLTVSVNPS